MDASTRPPQKRHQAFGHLALCLVAVLFSVTPLQAATNNNADALPAEQKQIPAPAAHDVAITTVEFGQEGLQLSARFTENGPEIVQDVDWSIRNNAKDVVFKGITSIADAALPPGDYQVEATYGTAHIVQGLSLQQGTKVDVSFVLNAGGLRLLPRVKGINAAVANRSMVYALTGIFKGQLITTSHNPGEVIKMSAGTYRIESRFDGGNAVAVTDVEVKAGKMTAVQIDHKAGLANLSIAGVDDADVQWTIIDENGATLPPISGAVATLVLKPGHYLVDATVAGTKRSTEFDIAIGQTQDVSFTPH
jgi:major membrane immunogen (membrane-anchored lipoprotein)